MEVALNSDAQRARNARKRAKQRAKRRDRSQDISQCRLEAWGNYTVIPSGVNRNRKGLLARAEFSLAMEDWPFHVESPLLVSSSHVVSSSFVDMLMCFLNTLIKRDCFWFVELCIHERGTTRRILWPADGVVEVEGLAAQITAEWVAK